MIFFVIFFCSSFKTYEEELEDIKKSFKKVSNFLSTKHFLNVVHEVRDDLFDIVAATLFFSPMPGRTLVLSVFHFFHRLRPLGHCAHHDRKIYFFSFIRTSTTTTTTTTRKTLAVFCRRKSRLRLKSSKVPFYLQRCCRCCWLILRPVKIALKARWTILKRKAATALH